MLYLLDANVLIDAGRDYYPLEMVPEFWDWLVHHGSIGAIKLPLEMYEEVSDGNDPLAQWLRDPQIKTALVLAEEVDTAIVARVVAEGYAPNLTDDEVIKIGRDPFLISYGLIAPRERCNHGGIQTKAHPCQSSHARCVRTFLRQCLQHFRSH